MRVGLMLAAAIGLIGPYVIAPGARADSSPGNDRNPTCPPGEVYDARTGKCTRLQAGVLPDQALTDYADALLKAGRYGEVIGVLDVLKNPNTAVALNYRGYATRKLGRVDEGIGYYMKSIALDPHYAQVREYLGEAYLVKGDAGQAKAQLAAIKQICGTTCDAYQHLAVAIADPTSL
jgi:tetratricopeptide (TPR) repeat protein